MTLHVAAYADCTITTVELDEEGEPTVPSVIRARVNECYPERADGIVKGAWYRHGRHMRFRAGSYHEYSEWRRRLALMAGYRAENAWEGTVPGAPFLGLVDFADNYGSLGSSTCGVLAADFRTWDDVAALGMSSEDLKLYRQFQVAFNLASQDGMVVFT